MSAVEGGSGRSELVAHLSPARLARECGIRVQTIQRWQKRYGFPDGVRSPGGHRRYTDADVERLRRLLALRESGMTLTKAIRVVTSTEPDDEADLLLSAAERGDGLGLLRAEGMRALEDLDEVRLWRIIDSALARFDDEDVIHELLIPLIRTTDDPSDRKQPEKIQAFFFSRIAAASLSQMAANYRSEPGAPQVWVACPEGEAHEVAALAAVVLLAKRGLDVRYLGANIPLRTLRSAVLQHRPDAVVLSVTRSLVVRDLLSQLAELYDVTEVFVAGHGAWRAQTPNCRAHLLLDDLRVSVDQLISIVGSSRDVTKPTG